MQGSETPACVTVYIPYMLRDSLLQLGAAATPECLKSKDLGQGSVWERRRGLSPDPRALCSAHTLLLAAQHGLGACSEPPPEEKPGHAENPDRPQSSGGHFCLGESRVMGLAASHGSRIKHQPCWAAAKQ